MEHLENPVKVYNFEVEDWHTYYVTEMGVLVHNMREVAIGGGLKTIFDVYNDVNKHQNT